MPDYLRVYQTPGVKLEHLIMAFGGWPDAAEGATTAVKYFRHKLQATKFAEVDPEEFYDFTQTRPYSSLARDGRRRVQWPANEFFYWPGQGEEKGVLFFQGVEPNLRWRTFSAAIAGLAEQCGVKTVIHLGALLDAVPHTREVVLTGSATRPDLQLALDSASIRSSKYQGPTGITSAVMEACTSRGMGYASLWGHTPHYIQAAPNYRVSYTLSLALARLLDLHLDLAELASAASTFDEEVAKAIDRDEQLRDYLKKLEERYDQSVAASEMPNPEEAVQDLERFLRSERRRGREGPEG